MLQLPNLFAEFYICQNNMVYSKCCVCYQRITCTVNSDEQKRLLMDLDVNMRSGSCPYTVKFYGALWREVSVTVNRSDLILVVKHISRNCLL